MQLRECQEKLNVRRSEVDTIIERERAIKEELTKTLGDGNKYEEFLTKLFQRKIKRTRVSNINVYGVKT